MFLSYQCFFFTTNILQLLSIWEGVGPLFTQWYVCHVSLKWVKKSKIEKDTYASISAFQLLYLIQGWFFSTFLKQICFSRGWVCFCRSPFRRSRRLSRTCCCTLVYPGSFLCNRPGKSFASCYSPLYMWQPSLYQPSGPASEGWPTIWSKAR